MKYLLDTDHISILQRRTGPDFQTLPARASQHPPGDLAFSLVSFHEQALGCHDYISRARSPAQVIRGYTLFGEVLQGFTSAPVLPFDAAAAAVFGLLVAQRVRVGTMDLRIASIALARGLKLLTRNVKDFGKVPGLVTEDWSV